MASPPLGISNIELLPKSTSEDVTSPEANILLMLIRSAATYVNFGSNSMLLIPRAGLAI
jgi:hypothetical protein